MKIRVGIVGCGAIGTYLIKTIIKDYKKQVSLIGVCEPDNSKVIEAGNGDERGKLAA
ncbi:MAG: hypothetical protein HY810_00615 [Candidatus Omnitrophica bacterium]|nr:hypothetical protein [Candidatus Omnitrophota bacterium]